MADILEMSELVKESEFIDRTATVVSVGFENYSNTETINIIEKNLQLLGVENTNTGYEGFFSNIGKNLKKIWKFIIESLKKILEFIGKLIKKIMNVITRPFKSDKKKKEEIKKKQKEAQEKAKKEQKDLDKEMEELATTTEFKSLKRKTLENYPAILYLTNGLEPRRFDKFMRLISEIAIQFKRVFQEGCLYYYLPRLFLDWLIKERNLDRIIASLVSGDVTTLEMLKPKYDEQVKAAARNLSVMKNVYYVTYNEPDVQRVCDDILKLNNLKPSETVDPVVIITAVYPKKIHYMLVVTYLLNMEKNREELNRYLVTKPKNIDEWIDYFRNTITLLTKFFNQSFTVREGIMTEEDIERLGYNIDALIEKSEVPVDSEINQMQVELEALDSAMEDLRVDKRSLREVDRGVSETRAYLKMINEEFSKMLEMGEMNEKYKDLAQAWMGFTNSFIKASKEINILLRNIIHWYKSFIETDIRTSDYMSLLLDYYLYAVKGEDDE